MSDPPIKILLVEDNAGDARLLHEMLHAPGSPEVELTHRECMRDAVIHLAESAVNMALVDLVLPDTQGLGSVQQARAAAPRVPLVVLTALDDQSLATQALQAGAQDYLVKGQIETRGLFRAMRYAIDRQLAEEVLFEEKERAQVTLNCIGDAVLNTDIAGNVTYLNLVAASLTGWTREAAIGRPLEEVFRILDGATRETCLNPLKMAMQPRRTDGFIRNTILVRSDGTEFSIEDAAAPIHDRQGRVTGAVIVFHDVSATRAMTLEMSHSARHDVLTGLPNRAMVNDRMTQAISLARRHNGRFAVLFMDLDHFKHINDSLGHLTGDKLLQSIAERLVPFVRGSDTLSRQGGDEFVLLLSEIGHPRDAARCAKKMLTMLKEQHFIGQHGLEIGASIGISIYPDDGLDPETLIQTAETAMYQAKADGHNNYKFFRREMNTRAVERQSIEESLRGALHRQEFLLQFQPKIDLATGTMAGSEALLRWLHPERGLIPPLQFIPIAEECGLILPIGRWALREACRQAQVWRNAGLPHMPVAVNISAIEFRDPYFLGSVRLILKETRLEPRFLELELTESVLMHHAEATAAVLRALKAMGVRLTVDDFGTGYSSLSYLRRFPIDALKIDQSFVHEVTSDADAATIVIAMINLGRSLKQRVIAEGVETPEQLAFLQTHCCKEGQGYYFSRPVFAEQFATFLKSGITDIASTEA